MRNSKWLLILQLLLLLLSQQNTQAQDNGTVSGTVAGAADGRPLNGASVRLKGSSKGTTTDADGKFIVRARAGDVLEISSVGFQSQQVTVGATTTINIQLTAVPNGLEEIIVIGYGSQRKKTVTGSTVRVTGGELEKNHNVSVAQSLQGQAAGVQVTTNSGQPGDALRIRLRGVGTNGDPNPLFVVDGMPTGDISYLNPSDVESIDVHKDAAAASIYGAQGANGVVFITTKKGKAGKRSVTLDAYYGWQNPMKKLDMLNGREYSMILNEAGINSGKAPFDASIYPFTNYNKTQLDSIGNGTDWQKAATIENASIQSYNLGFSGGNDQSVYSSSLGYQKQQGIIGLPGRSFYERITFRMNSEHKLYKDIIKTGENLTYTHSNQSGIGTGNIYGNSIRALLNTSPLFPVYNPDGTYGRSQNAEEVNPIAAMNYLNNNRTVYDKVFGNIYAEAMIIKGLRFRTDFGIDLSYNSNNSFIPLYNLSSSQLTTTTTASQGLYRNFTWNWDNTLTYQHSFGDHSFTLLAGHGAKQIDGFFVNGSKQDLIIPDFENAVINAGTNALTQKIFGSRSQVALQSWFGRFIYSYQDKYLVTASFRRDGSSNFSANKRYGNFPAVSAGWVASNEEFLKEAGWLNFLKVRASWGRNGNDRIGSFKYLATVSSLYQGYYFGGADNTSISVGTSPDKIPNSNLKWEAGEQTDVGLDATIAKDFSVTLDLYNKTTRDWLVAPPIPDVVGTGAPYINGGDIRNKGIELAINYRHTFGEVSVGLGGNISFIKNQVLQVPTADGIIHGATNVLSSTTEEFYRIEAGHPLGYFWGYQTNGIFQDQAAVANYTGKLGAIQPGALPGDIRFVDRNGDGLIDAKDKTQIGSPLPAQTFGISLTAAYKAFDISILMSGVGGNQIVDGMRATDRYYNNYTTAILERWHGTGTSNSLPRVTLGDEPNKNWGRVSDLLVHGGAFLRVKSVNIGYDLKKGLLKNLPMRTLRLYASGLNLWTFTHYRGIDPEIGYGNTETDGNNWSTGIDLGYYPQPRTLMVGLNVGF
jgi:TonB-linked SusC/RagA family outer membrane protein